MHLQNLSQVLLKFSLSGKFGHTEVKYTVVKACRKSLQVVNAADKHKFDKKCFYKIIKI